nr:hypothetical protein BaRGS_031320 [Batillaria attramentaria]
MAVGRVIRCGPYQFNLRNITVEPVLFLYMFAANIVFPTLQALAYDKVCYQNGLCGGIIACLMAVFSYITHIASPESKTMRIGIVESMIFMAGTLGVFISGAS